MNLFNNCQNFENVLKNDLIHSNKNIVGIIAPTGIGKTCTMIKYFSEHEYEKSLIILPTQFACDQWKQYHHSRCHIMNSSKALDFLQSGMDLSYTCYILDEAHMDSKEYFAIILFLKQLTKKNNEIRLFFVTATFPYDYFLEWFPNMSLYEYDHIQSPFSVTVEYYPNDISLHYVNRKMIYENMVSIIEKNIHEKRMVCFLATHEDCDNVYEKIIEQKFTHRSVFLFHGGLEPEEKQKIKFLIHTVDEYILLCTNIAESSVTIPDLDLIIDSGIECRMNGNRFNVVYASRMSLIQRAGRCGRTKNGRVFRMMGKNNFDFHLEEEFRNEYHLESIAIRSYFYHQHPISQFGEYFLPIVLYLDNLGIHHKTSKKDLEFYTHSRLDPLCAVLALKVLHSYMFSQEEKVFIFFVIVILHFISEKIPKWLYLRKKKWEERKKIFTQIYNLFNYDNDFLITHARVLLTFMFQDNWRDLATKLSFNHKIVREFYGFAFSCFRFSFPNINDFRKILSFTLNDKNVVNIPSQYIEKCRLFFSIHSPETPTSFLCYNECFSIQNDLEHSLGGCSLVRKGKNRNIQLIKTRKHIFWIYLPEIYSFHQKELEENVHLAYTYAKQKMNFKRIFGNVIQEINDEVAYRPNMVKMLQAFDDFEKMIVSFSLPIE